MSGVQSESSTIDLSAQASPAPSVAAITVAFNAEKRIDVQLRALQSLGTKVQEIIVVDNGSTDRTSEIVASRFPDVTLLRLHENLGQGGGWATGLKYAALTKAHDWAWTLDDDSIPNSDALEQMLKVPEDGSNADVGIIAALPYHADTGKIYPPLLWKNGFVKPQPKVLAEPMWFADLVFASGSMIRRDVIANVGLPRADFFMDFSDFEYCLRARRNGYRIAVVNAARISHEVGKAREVRIFGRTLLWPNHPAWREYYMARNLVYTVWNSYPSSGAKRFVARHLLRHAVGLMLFGEDKREGIKAMWLGWRHGRKGKLGAHIRPSSVGRKMSSRIEQELGANS